MRLNKILLKRAVAAFAAACTLGTCCVAGSVAWAAGGATTATEADTANIDTTKANSTSITIHKYEAPELKDAKHDGRELDSKVLVDTVGSSSVAKKQVKGVEFTVWRLKSYQTGTNDTTKVDEDIDLSKADGWKKIDKVQYLKLSDASKNGTTVYTVDQLMNGDTSAKLAKQFNKYPASTTTPAPAPACTAAAAQTEAGAKCVTGDDGSVKLDQLPMGLYYIEETDISKAKIDNNKVSITTKVAPFFITTPLPNSDTATQKTKPWLYDVNVYPKNDINPEVPTKTGSVNRQDLAKDETIEAKENQPKKTIEGTRVTWTVSIPLTAPSEGKKYTKIGFIDRLIDKLTYEKIASAKIITYKEQTNKDNTKEWIKDDSTDEVKLTKDTDYELTNPVKGTETGQNNNTLTFKLKEGTAAVTGGAKATGLKAAYDAYTKANESTNPKKLAKLVVEIVTKVDDTSLNEIANVANTFVDDNKTGNGDNPDKPCTPTTTGDPNCDDNTPNEIMHFGTLTVSKFFKGGAENEQKKMPLNGAKFDLYEVTGKPAAKKGDPETTITSTDLPGTTTFAAGVTNDSGQLKIKTNPKSGEGVSYNVKKITHEEKKGQEQATGEATTLETKKKTVQKAGGTSEEVNGTDSVRLLVYKAPKDNPKSVATTRLYCVVETEPPAGYKLDSAPHCVWLQEDITATNDNAQTVADRVAANLVEVENFKATELDKILGSLPMTGARGLVILTLCGIVGIAGTFFYIVLKRRKEQEQE